MSRRRTGWILVGLALVATLAIGLALMQAAPPRTIRVATGQAGGMYDTYGREYRRHLGGLGLTVQTVVTTGSVDNLVRLIDRRADAAFAQAGTYALVADARRVLRGVAALYVEPLWIFYRGERRLGDVAALSGGTIAVGPPASGTEAVARALLDRHGVSERARLVNLPSAEARERLERGALDAVFAVTSYRDADVQRLLRHPGVRLMSVARHEVYTRTFPFLAAVLVPEGLFDLKDNVPAEELTLLAPTALLLCRDDLHPRVVEMLLGAAQSIHGPGDLMNVPGRFPSREGMDVPLHEAADHYLRSGASWLSRVLPYWALRWAWLLPLVVVWVPIMRVLPEIDAWRESRVVSRCYRRLREVEATIVGAEGPQAVHQGITACEALRCEVEVLARRLPVRRQRSIYQWRQHAALVLHEARERLRAMTANPA